MDLEIKPYESVGILKFGMTREACRRLLGHDFGSVKISPGDDYPVDYYSKGFSVFYKDPGIIEAIEIRRPANPILQNINLLDEKFILLAKYFKENYTNTIIDGTGLYSMDNGIVLYASLWTEERDCVCEYIFAFEKGYYDGNLETIKENEFDLNGRRVKPII